MRPNDENDIKQRGAGQSQTGDFNHKIDWESVLAKTISLDPADQNGLEKILEILTGQLTVLANQPVLVSLIQDAINLTNQVAASPDAERPLLLQVLNERIVAIRDGSENPFVAGLVQEKQSMASRPAANLNPVEPLPPANGQPADHEDNQSCEDAMDAEMAKSFIPDFMAETLERMESVESNLLHLETEPQNKELLNAVFRAFHSTKGTANFLGLNKIKVMAHEAEAVLAKLRDGKLTFASELADLILQAADMLKAMTKALEGYLKDGTISPPPQPFTSLLANLAACGQARPTAGQPAPLTPAMARTDAAPAPAPPAPAPAPETKNDVNPPECAKPEQNAEEANLSQGSKTVQTNEGTLRVSTKKMDQLINLVGELVIGHAIIAQNDEQGRNLTRDIVQLGKIIRSMQDLSMSLRMVPMRSTFFKMERIARDLARTSGKSIQFITEGEETEIDRNMVELISDPLVHLIRNAVDHGLESTAERLAAGKVAAGTIMLKACHRAGNVVIEVTDDGRGLNRERILAKAVRMGIAEGERVYPEAEINNMIFLPGFSTAEQVTEVSGRGVGLDVVRRNIESLNGRIQVLSAIGQGASFVLRIPLTLAIIDGLLLRIGAQQYLVPTLNVKHVFRPVADQLTKVQGKGEMVMFLEHLIPVFHLHQLFKLPEAVTDATQGLLMVVEHENQTCAFLIDELLGQQQVVIKSMGDGLGKITGISGAAILGDGRIRLILDVPGVTAMIRNSLS